MNLSNILKQKKITQDLEDKIKQSIDATSAYLRTVNQGNEKAIEAVSYTHLTLPTKA